MIISPDSPIQPGSIIQIVPPISGSNTEANEDLHLKGTVLSLNYPSNKKGKVLTQAYQIARVKWSDGIETNIMSSYINKGELK